MLFTTCSFICHNVDRFAESSRVNDGGFIDWNATWEDVVNFVCQSGWIPKSFLSRLINLSLHIGYKIQKMQLRFDTNTYRIVESAMNIEYWKILNNRMIV